ncbi:UDP-glucose dehydrogenase family protein [Massilia sp. TSP1-1-2]|uniref:UDP-glucose dehydrogenase family protein n=1 Tax=Massilia sp. TSP1-1-2 TaxID=2804649 RepID=UPI003CEB9763
MKITIIGTGYVGLVAGACFADVGNTILCLDVDAARIELLKNGTIPIHEPGLDQLVVRNANAGRLTFTTSYDDAITHAEVIFLAVGTPSLEDGRADLTQILAVARSIGERIVRPVVIVDKSTVPVGSADKISAVVAAELARRQVDVTYAICSNPEFLKEGAAIDDFMKPARIVVGSEDPATIKLMRQLYAPFNRNHEKMVMMNVRSAELTKYAANAMLATRISFMNELAGLAEQLGADIESVRQGIGSDPRIGPDFLYAGTGYGGSCFPKDIAALVNTAAEYDQQLRILSATEAVNNQQKTVLYKKLVRFFGGADNLEGKTIALWGLSFKPNTDDMREASSLTLIRSLFHAGANVVAYDPVANAEALRILQAEYGDERCAKSLRIVTSAMHAAADADVLVLMTEWKEFRSPDFAQLAKTLRHLAIFDGRNIYDPDQVASAGLRYEGIGRIRAGNAA